VRAIQAFIAYLLSVSRTPPRRGRAHIKERQVKALRALSSVCPNFPGKSGGSKSYCGAASLVKSGAYGEARAIRPQREIGGAKGWSPMLLFVAVSVAAVQLHGRPISVSTVLRLIVGAFGGGGSLLRRRLISRAGIERRVNQLLTYLETVELVHTWVGIWIEIDLGIKLIHSWSRLTVEFYIGRSGDDVYNALTVKNGHNTLTTRHIGLKRFGKILV
jgi:hypothetical protein